jgi:hypothetical protein
LHVVVGVGQQRAEDRLGLAGGQRQAHDDRGQAAAAHADEVVRVHQLAPGHRGEIAQHAFDQAHGFTGQGIAQLLGGGTGQCKHEKNRKSGTPP